MPEAYICGQRHDQEQQSLTIAELTTRHKALLRGTWPSMGPGWTGLLDELLTQLARVAEQQQWPLPDITSVKEKFGSLHVYGQDLCPEQMDLIAAAEEESMTVCDVCGSPGSLRTDGWYRTRCDEHAAH